MSSIESSDTPTPASNASQPYIELLRRQRTLAGYVLLGLSLGFLAATIFLFSRGMNGSPSKASDKPTDSKTLDPSNPEKALEEVDPKRGEYFFGGLGTALGLIATASVGIWFVISIPNPSISRQRTEIRVALLVLGLVLGAILIVIGLGYLYIWSDSIFEWLDKDQEKEMKWVIIPLLMVGLGDGLILAAVQPARVEERANRTIRRLVYGSNLSLAVMLLFEMLIIVNVASGLFVKNRLDTTSTGFYSLSQPSEAVLAQLDQPVTAYAIIPGSGPKVFDDTRRLLQSCEDVAGSRFKVKYISPQLNKAELASLRAKYTQLEVNDNGVLLTIGDEAQQAGSQVGRYVFIPIEDFIDREASREQQGQQVFGGEAKLIREVIFLAENKQKPIVYFTQCAGELDPNGTDRRGASASQLKSFLEKNYIDVRSHQFDLLAPVVPTDADILIVASPNKTIPPLVAEAIKKYMNEPRQGNKFGKLMVLCGSQEPRSGAPQTPMGLEGLLAEYNILIGDKYMIGFLDNQFTSELIPAEVSGDAIQKKNSVALTLRRQPMTFVLPREVSAIGGNIPGKQSGNPSISAIPILDTITDYVWLEDTYPENMGRAFSDMRRDPQKKQVTKFKHVGALASDSKTNTSRVAVYGCGFMASDRWAQQFRGTAPLEFDLIGVTIDWLRDRSPAPTGIAAKTNVIYSFPAKVNSGRTLYLPLGISLLAVIGLGVGVLMLRRG